MAERRSAGHALITLPKEAIDDWWTELVLEWVETVDDFFQEDMQLFGFLWCWSVLATICQVEFQHGRNRQAANENNLWHNFRQHKLQP